MTENDNLVYRAAKRSVIIFSSLLFSISVFQDSQSVGLPLLGGISVPVGASKFILCVLVFYNSLNMYLSLPRNWWRSEYFEDEIEKIISSYSNTVKLAEQKLANFGSSAPFSRKFFDDMHRKLDLYEEITRDLSQAEDRLSEINSRIEKYARKVRNESASGVEKAMVQSENDLREYRAEFQNSFNDFAIDVKNRFKNQTQYRADLSEWEVGFSDTSEDVKRFLELIKSDRKYSKIRLIFTGLERFRRLYVEFIPVTVLSIVALFSAISETFSCFVFSILTLSYRI